MSFGGDGGMMEYAKENMAYRLTMGETGGGFGGDPRGKLTSLRNGE